MISPTPKPTPGTLTILWSSGEATMTDIPSDLADKIITSIGLGSCFSYSYLHYSGAINPAHVMEATYVALEVKT